MTEYGNATPYATESASNAPDQAARLGGTMPQVPRDSASANSVDVAMAKDGALLVSDDGSRTIWRVAAEKQGGL